MLTKNASPEIGSIYSLADIDWRVLAVENNRALLISEEIIEMRPYNYQVEETTWEQCTLRQYLNSEFYNKLGDVKSAISETQNSNLNNQWFGTKGGKVTSDKIFLLSLDEVCRYFGDSSEYLKKGSTEDYYVISDSNDDDRIAKYNGKESWWWLQSPGYYRHHAARIYTDGNVDVHGDYINSDVGGVRPALWLNL